MTARRATCQAGVIGVFRIACATIEGISDRVQANTTPKPIAVIKRLTTMPTL